ncbi:MAG: aldo/keto reductase [Nitrospinota bacterium]
MKRREFFSKTALSALGSIGIITGSTSLAFSSKQKKDGQLRVKSYRPLGKTGLKISDIAFGGGALSSAALLARAVDSGINYVDTAPDYGRSQRMVGAYMKKASNKDKLIIASKFCETSPYPGHLGNLAKSKDYIRSVEQSLKTLNRDYIDIVFVHAIGEKGKDEENRLLSDEMLNGFNKLKKDGKVRFLGVSSHGPNNMESLMEKAIDSGYYDLIMPAFNFMKFPKLDRVIKKAYAKNVGIIAMKSLAGGKHANLKLENETFEVAALKWVLKHKEIAGTVITMKNYSDIDHYLQASGEKFGTVSMNILKQYKEQESKKYCRTGCGDCLTGCPLNIDIATILRYKMYYESYNEQKRAMVAYSKLAQKANICDDCTTRGCEDLCSYNIPISSLLTEADRNLTFSA